jgi:hypothetical protein
MDFKHVSVWEPKALTSRHYLTLDEAWMGELKYPNDTSPEKRWETRFLPNLRSATRHYPVNALLYNRISWAIMKGNPRPQLAESALGNVAIAL